MNTQIKHELNAELYPELNFNLVVTDDEVNAFNDVFLDERMRTKEGIQAFSEYVEGCDDSLGDDPFPLFHTFGAGTYTREIHMPKGYVVIGKLHRGESMVYMLEGKVLVSDESGVKTIEAPCQFVSKGGIKRVGYVIEDVVWIDIHATDKTTIKEAEKEIFMDSFKELESYEGMIKELGHTPEDVKKASEITDDIIGTIDDTLEVNISEIEGKGVFAKNDIKEGSQVGIARIYLKRTLLGRYANHSFKSNSTARIMNKSMYFIAKENIKSGDEITVDYRNIREVAEELDTMIYIPKQIGWLS